MKTILSVMLLPLMLLPLSVSAQVRYYDEKGTPYWVQSSDQVPMKFREKMETPRLPEVEREKGRSSGGGGLGFVPVINPNLMIRICKAAIADRLKAPATATYDLSVIGRFKVGGDVDAENSYGALVRGYGGCEFSLNGHLEDVFVTTRR